MTSRKDTFIYLKIKYIMNAQHNIIEVTEERQLKGYGNLKRTGKYRILAVY